jgi:hypothetical protein
LIHQRRSLEDDCTPRQGWIEYIQKPSAMTAMPVSIVLAIVGALVRLTEAP